MVGSNLLQIAAVGPEDAFLYGNPQFTYFKSVYRRHCNFASTYCNITNGDLSTKFALGQTIRITIPRKGDLLGGIYLQMSLSDLRRVLPFWTLDSPYDPTDTSANNIANATYDPQFTSFVNGVGSWIIKEIRLKIGEHIVERHIGETIFLNNELSNNIQNKTAFYKMTKYSGTAFTVGSTNTDHMDLILPIPFYFTEDPSVYLPMLALSFSEVNIEITLSTLSEILVHAYNTGTDISGGFSFNTNPPGMQGYQVDSSGVKSAYGATLTEGAIINESCDSSLSVIEMIGKFYYLDTEEKDRYIKMPIQYLISTHSLGLDYTINEPVTGIAYQTEMIHKFPTKYLLWVLQRADVNANHQYDNYSSENPLLSDGSYFPNTYANILSSARILLNNEEVVENVSALIYSKIEQYDKFQTDSVPFLYMYSFALHPHSYEPSGTINLTRIRNKVLETTLGYAGQNILIRNYAKYYNILTIRDGLAGLYFI